MQTNTWKEWTEIIRRLYKIAKSDYYLNPYPANVENMVNS